MNMVLRKAAFLLLAPTLTTGYFSDVNNAHVQLLHSDPVALETNNLELLLENKLWGDHTPSSVVAEFESWIEKFERRYETVSEKGERLLVWLENHALIESHNAKQATFTLAHNEYSDMTFTEFQQRFNLHVKAQITKTKFNFAHAKDGAQSKLRGATEETSISRRLEDDKGVDWAALGLCGPLRNQGLCGACWAFSAIGSIESAMAIKKYNAMTPQERGEDWDLVGVDSKGRITEELGLVIPLSEQNLIDCDTVNQQGCDGGLMITDFDEEEGKAGICTENDYPYTQAQGTCSSSMCTPVPGSRIKDHVDIEPRKTANLVEALKVNPVTAAMVASDPMFQFYSSGIYSVADCGKVTKEKNNPECELVYDNQDTCLPDVNHGVLVVGYGTDDTVPGDVKDFFKVKNSWGDSWGEGGYFRIARYDQDPTDPKTNWGECAILSLLSYPVME
jgi:C1A family cysteine protease